MARKIAWSAFGIVAEAMIFMILQPPAWVLLLTFVGLAVFLVWTWEGLPEFVWRHQQDDRALGLGLEDALKLAATKAASTRSWSPGQPIPPPSFPIIIQVDRDTPISFFSAVPNEVPQIRSNLFALVNGLTLTNVSDRCVVAYIEISISKEGDRVRCVPAELAGR